MGKCRECKYCYANETMKDLYICVNGDSENFGQFTGICADDECVDCVFDKGDFEEE